MALPDFIIIGAMKCATSTLHEQLARQPGILMSEPKEPCFFSDDDQWRRGAAWYQGLFANAGQRALRGESSTHYTKLPTYPNTVARMLQMLPSSIRFIYIMRHPIDRLISHYIHEWTQTIINEPIERAIQTHSELMDYGRYAMQLAPYFDAFGRDRVLPVFFDRITSHPQQELERVCQFIGYAGKPKWRDEVREVNVSSRRLRRSAMRERIRDFPGARTLWRALLPEAVRERINSRWTMPERPTLEANTIARLTAIFDQDLAKLGQWLDVDLSCSNFKQVTANLVPCWSNAAGAALQ